MVRGRGRRKPKLEQLTLDRFMHGGTRPGAGRPRSKDSGVSHATRARVTDNDPVLVTTRIHAGLPSLRSFRAYRAVFESFQAQGLFSRIARTLNVKALIRSARVSEPPVAVA